MGPMVKDVSMTEVAVVRHYSSHRITRSDDLG